MVTVLRADYGDYRAALTQLFVSVDPLGLVATGAPDDEYEGEIARLLRWRGAVDAARVRRVFADLAVSAADAERLAAGIAAIRARFGYETRDQDS